MTGNVLRILDILDTQDILHILIIALIILVFVAVVMLSPILFTIQLKKDEKQQSNGLSITLWIFFIPLRFRKWHKTTQYTGDTGDTNSSTKKNPAKISGKNIKKRLGQGKLLIPLIRRFITSFIGMIEISQIKFHLLFGLDDPAGTGIGYGLLSSVMYPFKARYPASDIQITPNFAESVCEYEIAGAIRLRIFNIFYAILYTFVSRDMYVFIKSIIWKN